MASGSGQRPFKVEEDDDMDHGLVEKPQRKGPDPKETWRMRFGEYYDYIS